MATLLRFKEYYQKEIIKALQNNKELGYKNIHQIPKIEKIVVNMGVGEAAADSKVISHAVNDLMAITGQKPIIINAKKSVASFKLREGMPIGCKVTLRGEMAYSFLERLILIALPRIRDFTGFSIKNFDGRGNLSFGIREQIIFPEIDYDKIDAIRGMDVTIVTSAKTNKEAKELLSKFYIPFVA